MYKEFYKPQNYVNRELSWIDFNGRVLGEATDTANPLLERANFLGITQSNVDEFFMVRVASLHKLAAANVTTTDASGLTPEEQLDAVNEKEHRMVKQRYEVYKQQIIPDLAKNNIHILHVPKLGEKQYEFIRRYFNDELMPVLTPMADDASRPFPFISNNSLNIAVQLRRQMGSTSEPVAEEILEGDQEVHRPQIEPHDDRQEADIKFATVRVPEIYKRLVRLPGENSFIEIPTLKVINNVRSGLLNIGNAKVANYSENMTTIVNNIEGFKQIINDYQATSVKFYGDLEDLDPVATRYVADQLEVRTGLQIEWLNNNQLMAQSMSYLLTLLPDFEKLSKHNMYLLSIGLSSTTLAYFHHGSFERAWDIDLGNAKISQLVSRLRKTATNPTEIIQDYISSKLEYLTPELTVYFIQ